MKKILWLIVCLMTMVVSVSSCGGTYLATASYDVCYPDGVRTEEGSTLITSMSKPNVSCFSFDGTNYVAVGDLTSSLKGKVVINSTTAPMRLKTYGVKKVKNKRTYNRDGVY